MINDYFDLEGGVDSEDYVRAQYAPHPVLSGLISKKGLLLAIALVNLVDLVILLVLADARGPAMVTFALLGLFVSVFYVAPPIKLKHHGLGEPGVFLVWGPLMIGGTYYATAGTVAPWVIAASVPYALLVTSVLMGKHVDKLEADSAKGIHTLPVILGRDRALALTRGLMIAYFVLVGAAGRDRRARRLDAALVPGDPAGAQGARGVPQAEAGGAAAPLPDLAALVRLVRVPGHAQRRRPVRARAVARRDLPGAAAEPGL